MAGPIVAGAECADNHASCRDSGCCKSNKLYACYEKGPLYAECMPKGTCRNRWPNQLTPGESWPDSKTGTCLELEVCLTLVIVKE